MKEVFRMKTSSEQKYKTFLETINILSSVAYVVFWNNNVVTKMMLFLQNVD